MNKDKTLEVKTLKTKVIEQTKIINVPSSVIHIENNISLIQKKLWFELVYQAFPKMGTQRTHTITLRRLRELLGWSDSTSSDSKLKEALHGLNKIALQWNIFGKDRKRVWESFSMLSGCQIPENSGICIFDFSTFLEDRFLSMGQEAYVKIDLIISKKFQSKYALSLYCLALDFLMLDIGYSEKIFTLEELRKYLAIKEGEYKLAGHFNERIIKPAEKEINNTSDMNIEIKTIKDGKKISGYKLCMSLKEGRAKEYLDKKNRLREIANNRPIETLKYIEPKVKKEPEPKKNLIKISDERLKTFYAENDISMTPKTIQDKLVELKETFQDRFENYLLFLMNYTNKEDKRTTITSLSGFYIGLIKNDSQMENYFLYHQKQHEQEKEKLSKLNNLLEAELKTQYDKYLANDFENYIIQNVDRLENKIIEILKSKLKPGDFFYDVIIQKTYSGIVDKTLITKAKESVRMMTISYLRDNLKELKYKPISFEDWKDEEISEEYIEDLKENLLKSF